MILRRIVVIVSTCFLLVLSSCDGVPVDVVAGLEPETLRRIDAVTEILNDGIEVGPETLESFDELNETIRGKTLFTQEELTRIDRLLDLIERGIGPDDETRRAIEEGLRILDDYPDRWESVLENLVLQMEGSSEALLKQAASEVSEILSKARNDALMVAERGVAVTGMEIRCNVDFLSDKASYGVGQFIGSSIVGRIKGYLEAVLTGEKYVEPAPIPWVCHRSPNRILLTRIGEKIVPMEGYTLITFIGYNFRQDNLPRVQVVSNSGDRLSFEDIHAYPGSTEYEVEISIQNLDFSTVPDNSRIELIWPNTTNRNNVGLVFPEVVIRAELEITEDSVPIYRGPDSHYHILWRAAEGAVFEVVGQFGDWWKVKDERNQNREGWVHDDVVFRNDVTVPPISAPLPPPSAEIECTPTEVYAGESIVTCEANHIAGDDTGWHWEWDFGDGSGSETHNPTTHLYESEGEYTISLHFGNNDGWGDTSEVIAVNPLPAPPEANFTLSRNEGEAPLKIRITRDTPQASRWEWTLDNRTVFTNLDPNTSGKQQYSFEHTITEPGRYVLKLTAYDTHDQWSTASQTILVQPRAPIYQNSTFIVRYRGLSSRRFDNDPRDGVQRVQYDTDFKDEDFTCGVIGFSVRGAIANASEGSTVWADFLYEDPVPADYLSQGTIDPLDYLSMEVFMEPGSDGDWWINASLEETYRRESSNDQLWDVDMLCVHNNVFERGGATYIEYFTGAKPNTRNDLVFDVDEHVYKANTEVSSSDYQCGIVGFAFEDAVLGPSVPRSKFEIQTVDVGETWRVRVGYGFEDPSIREHGLWERANVLCLARDELIEVFKSTLPHESTGYSRYLGRAGDKSRCGVLGFSVTNMLLDTRGDYQLMVEARTLINDNVWGISAQILRSSGRHWAMENWDLNLICLDWKYVLWDFTFDCSAGSCRLVQ